MKVSTRAEEFNCLSIKIVKSLNQRITNSYKHVPIWPKIRSIEARDMNFVCKKIYLLEPGDL